jgi:hypothetical protein
VVNHFKPQLIGLAAPNKKKWCKGEDKKQEWKNALRIAAADYR